MELGRGGIALWGWEEEGSHDDGSIVQISSPSIQDVRGAVGTACRHKQDLVIKTLRGGFPKIFKEEGISG